MKYSREDSARIERSSNSSNPRNSWTSRGYLVGFFLSIRKSRRACESWWSPFLYFLFALSFLFPFRFIFVLIYLNLLYRAIAFRILLRARTYILFALFLVLSTVIHLRKNRRIVDEKRVSLKRGKLALWKERKKEGKEKTSLSCRLTAEPIGLSRTIVLRSEHVCLEPDISGLVFTGDRFVKLSRTLAFERRILVALSFSSLDRFPFEISTVLPLFCKPRQGEKRDDLPRSMSVAISADRERSKRRYDNVLRR